MDWLDLQVSREVGTVHGLAHARLPALKEMPHTLPIITPCLPCQCRSQPLFLAHCQLVPHTQCFMGRVENSISALLHFSDCV